MLNRIARICLLCVYLCPAAHAQTNRPFDAAAAFGARPTISDVHLSPDVASIVLITAAQGQASIAYTLSLAKGSTPQPLVSTDGKPLRLETCHWVANDRLACMVYGIAGDPLLGKAGFTRILAVDVGGKNVQVLSTRQNEHTRGVQLGGGSIIDWLPDENGAVLMTRQYLPDNHIGSKIGSSTQGLGVDRIDTRTLEVKHIEPPKYEAVDYITDGRGTVRIVGFQRTRGRGYDTGIISYSYRLANSRDWQQMCTYSTVDQSGFLPIAVDHDNNVAYGYQKKDGRLALYSVKLDDSLAAQLIYARPDVDVGEPIQLGRRNRLVGVTYSSDVRLGYYFSPDIESLATSLNAALPGRGVGIIDSSVDESSLLVRSSSDVDPGVYYIFDRNSHRLQTSLVTRGPLEGVQLAHVQPITYPAADGTSIPAYLTLPPGHETAKGLPAIVLPHGGPSERDEWGFDWLPQFFAARGFAVLQPNFRGSSGYGDAWFQNRGFTAWPVAIGDILDGGRWLVHEGIADPTKLAVVGWSYGGYAALQSAVVDHTVFKGVVAIAPVTDLALLKEEHRFWSDYDTVSAFIGDGPHLRDGSPSEHADKITVPVLLFHGGQDANVNIEQSRRMAARLKSAGGKVELVTFDDLDHQLEDSKARAQMLRQSDEFLRQALGM